MPRVTSGNPVVDFFGQDNAEDFEKTNPGDDGDLSAPAIEVVTVREHPHYAIVWAVILALAGTGFAWDAGSLFTIEDWTGAIVARAFAGLAWGGSI
jgi:hypothetical protein